MDVERIARDLLRGCGLACEFYVESDIPPALVTVKETSRPGSKRFEGRTMLTLQAWAESRGRARELCERAVDILVGRGDYEGSGGMVSADDNITGCRPENGPYRWDDPDVKDRKRWQATVSVDFNR